ncbi:MAG: hypothetical protein AB7P03_27690 [Kofleriaceae bacterium]
MGKDRSRIVVMFVAFVGMLVASTLVMDWFVIRAPLFGADVSHVGIDLRQAHACTGLGPCVSVPLKGAFKGMYANFATATLWGSIVFAILVGYQAVTRLVSGFASEALSKLGYMAGLGIMGNAFMTGYLFAPDASRNPMPMMGFSIEIERTWAPLLLMVALGVGVAICFAVISQSSDSGAAYQPLSSLPRAQAKPTPVGMPAAVAGPAPVADAPAPGPQVEVHEALRGKLQFAVTTAELTAAGIDARREDGSSELVMWRDVVGAVARRTPPEYQGVTFIDIVSTPGATIRVLPWTKLTGDPIDGTGEPRARALLALIEARCQGAKLDAATRAFVELREDAAQLPDLRMLAIHDQRLGWPT